MTSNTVLDSEERVAAYVEGWDRLAVERRRPLAAPAWMMAWWRHSGPDGGGLRVVAVEDDGELIGLAPYYWQPGRRRDYRMLSSGLAQRIEPLATPGREEDVAEQVASALKRADPSAHLVSLEGIPQASPWPALLKRRLGAAMVTTSVMPAPVVTLEGDFDAWMKTKSSNFRSQMKRARKKIEKEGGAIRMSTAETVDADIAAFMRLHEGRWEGRGESSILLDGIESMLGDVARDLLRSGRFRLWMTDLHDKPISAQLFVAAGGELCYWNGGFDEEYAQYKPAVAGIFSAIEDAFERGDERLDLGGGEHDYKLRFADGGDPLMWAGLILRGPRWPLIRAQMLPEVMRGALLRSLSAERKAKLKKLLRR